MCGKGFHQFTVLLRERLNSVYGQGFYWFTFKPNRKGPVTPKSGRAISYSK